MTGLGYFIILPPICLIGYSVKVTRLEQHASAVFEDVAKDLGQHERQAVVVTEDV